jgi:hypothetical protein
MTVDDHECPQATNGLALWESHQLQQRYIHNHSRASIPLSVLYEVSAAVLEELELQESWNLALVRPAVDAGGDLAVILEQEAEAFDELLSCVVEEHRSLRDLLLQPSE